MLVQHVCVVWLKHLVDNTQTATSVTTGRSHLDVDTPSPWQPRSPGQEGDSPASAAEAVVASMRAHTDLLVKAALFGPVYKKNIRSVGRLFYSTHSIHIAAGVLLGQEGAKNLSFFVPL